MGDFACNLIWQVISLYLLYFYTDVMKLNAAAIATMFVICRVIDGITDVLVGFAIDKTRTRWGKSRPWFLFGAVPFALSAFLAFSVPNISPGGKLAYAYATYIFLSFMYTVVNIPLASILPALTDDMNEFLSTIYYSAKAFRELTEYYSKVDRPVIICMVGDHAPAFISELTNSEYSVEEEAIRAKAVPYAIWSNRKLETDGIYTDYTTIYQLMPMIQKRVTMRGSGMPFFCRSISIASISSKL